ncbi:tail completion protein gp17 [Brassicibacter mesophilus]|uniref:tail completion protein gp17 n=1 Tax=Brassicibacter mesophilus TaxID=745119 RepID=UPI003D1AAC8F
METALRFELKNNISELAATTKPDGTVEEHIFPTNAPEGVSKPYLVYTRITTRKTKTLEGYTDKEALSYMFSIMANKYSEMKSLTKKVEDLLISMPKTSIGTQQIYIEDLDINNITEQYEHEMGVNRGIIDFTIYY